MMSKKRKGLIAASAVALLALTAWLCLPYVVRREIRKRAAERGMKVEVDSVKIRFGRVELRGVSVSTDRIPVRPFKLETATISFSGRLKITRVEASGAMIEVDGDMADILKKIEEQDHGKGEATNAVRITVDRLNVVWRGWCDKSGEAKADGVVLNMGLNTTVTAESAKASCGGLIFWAVGVEAVKGRVTAQSAEAAYAPTTLYKRASVKAVKAAMGGDVKSPWVTAETLEAVWAASSVSMSGVSASADIPAGKATISVAQVTLRDESLQGDITASAAEVQVSARTEKNGGWLSLSMKADRFSGTYEAVTGKQVTAKSISARGDVMWGEGFKKPWRTPGGWRMVMGNAVATMDAEVTDEGYTVSAQLGDSEGDGVQCKDLIQAIPEGMASGLVGFEAAGSVSASVKVVKSKSVSVKASLKNGCKFTKWPESMSPAALRKKFMRTVYGPEGQPIRLESGPGSKGWTAYGRMSKFLTASIQATEDPGFFRHHGIDMSAVENSIQQDMEAGRFVRGASTVSMQLAKNLWLNRVKTASRKIQEAFLTTYLEQVLTKEEILCLYFNVVEFGPGIYGIGPAADRFFKTLPENLSLGQSLFLASVLPRPKIQWFGMDGRIQEARMKWLHGLMGSMRTANLLTDGELQDGLSEWLVLGKPSEKKLPEEGPVVASPGGLDPDWNH